MTATMPAPSTYDERTDAQIIGAALATATPAALKPVTITWAGDADGSYALLMPVRCS